MSLGLGGQELMQRRIQITDGHRALTHDAVHGLEVTLLERLDLGQSSFALFHGTGADHLTDSLDAVLSEEHVLGAAQADGLGAKLERERGILGVVGINAHMVSMATGLVQANLVGPG